MDKSKNQKDYLDKYLHLNDPFYWNFWYNIKLKSK
jgi:hypothetical protein